MMGAAKSNALRRLVRRLNSEAHGDEAKALELVDVLMRVYALTRDVLTPEAEQLAEGLRELAREWDSAAPEHAANANVKRGSSWECPTCGQDMRAKPHDGAKNKNCPQCGQGLQWRKRAKLARKAIKNRRKSQIGGGP
jgi:predicted RNA-binding Zn-ribbon protein involved in translation (DUF1610 family)